MLTKFSNFEIKERDLQDAIKALQDSYESISEQGLSAQLNYYASTSTKQGPFFFSKKEILNSLNASTLQGLNSYYQTFKNSIFFEQVVMNIYQSFYYYSYSSLFLTLIMILYILFY